MHDEAISAAEQVVDLLREGRFEDLERRFAPILANAVSADTVRTGWASETAKIGGVRALGEAIARPGGGDLTQVVVPIHGENGDLDVRMALDPAGLLHGLRIAPPAASAWTPPRYARPRRFVETDISLAAGAHTVPSTMTLPRRGRGWPAVVLLASGASDRDVTVGPNKPFKDLAWGLASRGVAVVRFDKVTHVDTRVAHQPGFTMVDEYHPSALAAVRLLREQPGVDPRRVFVSGISGGGKAAVRVAASDPSIAGVVMLAADTVPLPRAAARIFDYVSRVEPSAAADAALPGSAEAIARTEDPALSPETPGDQLLFAWPASYWLDLRDFDQVATAASLGRPILVLQGGRDYQVTESQDLARWREGLEGAPDVTIRVLPGDDHMFFAGAGPSRPSDYYAPQHMDPELVAIVARWLKAR